MYEIKPVNGVYRAFVDEQITANWAGPFVVSKGVLHDTRAHTGFVAVNGDAVTGYILYNIEERSCEITVIESLLEKQGIGAALVDAVIQAAKRADCRRVWLITTNDNTNAIRFYQRMGFSLYAVHINALEESRRLKPQIPLVGFDEIPIAHEFEFELTLKREIFAHMTTGGQDA